MIARTAAAALAFAALAGCGGREAAPAREALSLQTADGVTLGGTLLRPRGGGAGAPGLLLAHREGLDRSAWDGFAEQAQQAGYLVLAFDLRGHGASTRRGETRLSYRNFPEAEWRGALADFAAGKEALLASGASPANLAVAGEGIGANLALLYAAAEPAMQAAALLSPGREYRGIAIEQAMLYLRDLPVLLLAGDGDTYSATTARTLKALAQGFCELRTYGVGAHGTDIFALAPGSAQDVLTWLGGILNEE